MDGIPFPLTPPQTFRSDLGSADANDTTKADKLD